MSDEALYGLILLAAMVLALGGGISLVNWLFSRRDHNHHQTRHA